MDTKPYAPTYGFFYIFSPFPLLQTLIFLGMATNQFLGFLTGIKNALSVSLGKKCEESDNDDMIDVLLKLQQKGELEFNVPSNHIKAVTLEVFAAGSETSATTIEWAMSELMKHPRVMEKAQAKVRHVLEGQRNFDEANIQKLNYLKLVVKETLRLHPPGALIPRESREKCEIYGYEIPNNTKLVAFAPRSFKIPLFIFKGSNLEFIPFGGGRRICPGISFGLASIELVLSQLLYHFNWKLTNEIKPEELNISETFGLSYRRKNVLYLIATPLKHLLHGRH
ncbi:hypothetical protein ACB092_11G180500 [Castanea dentata]